MGTMIYVVAAGVAGLLLGMGIMYVMHRQGHDSGQTKAVEKKLERYQQEVEQHFAKTADLIDNLTSSYQEVFQHLSDSAEHLLTEEQIKNQLINRKSREVTIKYLKSQDDEQTQNPAED
jgi:uncharacterized membrane-anchored protein YhcB (DUF1043 family)